MKLLSITSPHHYTGFVTFQSVSKSGLSGTFEQINSATESRLNRRFLLLSLQELSSLILVLPLMFLLGDKTLLWSGCLLTRAERLPKSPAADQRSARKRPPFQARRRWSFKHDDAGTGGIDQQIRLRFSTKRMGIWESWTDSRWLQDSEADVWWRPKGVAVKVTRGLLHVEHIKP